MRVPLIIQANKYGIQRNVPYNSSKNKYRYPTVSMGMSLIIQANKYPTVSMGMSLIIQANKYGIYGNALYN